MPPPALRLIRTPSPPSTGPPPHQAPPHPHAAIIQPPPITRCRRPSSRPLHQDPSIASFQPSPFDPNTALRHSSFIVSPHRPQVSSNHLHLHPFPHQTPLSAESHPSSSQPLHLPYPVILLLSPFSLPKTVFINFLHFLRNRALLASLSLLDFARF